MGDYGFSSIRKAGEIEVGIFWDLMPKTMQIQLKPNNPDAAFPSPFPQDAPFKVVMRHYQCVCAKNPHAAGISKRIHFIGWSQINLGKTMARPIRESVKTTADVQEKWLLLINTKQLNQSKTHKPPWTKSCSWIRSKIY